MKPIIPDYPLGYCSVCDNDTRMNVASPHYVEGKSYSIYGEYVGRKDEDVSHIDGRFKFIVCDGCLPEFLKRTFNVEIKES